MTIRPFNVRSGISERGSGVRDTELRKSDYKGDVFYEPVWPAGHVGIFGGNDWIVEAPGVGQVSHWKWVWDKRVIFGDTVFLLPRVAGDSGCGC